MKLTRLRQAMLCALLLCMATITHAEAVWIDVRSAIEHRLDSIEGDIRISHDEIVPEVTRLFPDRSTEIQLYCRSGARAGKALSALRNAGYTNVENAGGIENARTLRNLEN